MYIGVRRLLLLALLIGFTTGHAQVEPRTTVGGYGELHYNEPEGSALGQLDFHRFVLYVGHVFNDKLSFTSEIEIEHTLVEAGTDRGGELSLEQAFLDYRIRPPLGIRAGILLPPVGLINLHHEPPTFNGVERPSVDHVIIPTTWREAGVGIYGTPTEQLDYQFYVLAGFDAAGFDARNGLRGGRQKAFMSNAANPSLTGRLDFSPEIGLQLGASFFIGNSSAGNDSIGNPVVSLWSGDARYTLDDLSLRGVAVVATINDADKINAKFGRNVADRIYGYYVEAAYNILSPLCPESEQQVNLFARYEKYDTQAATTGFPRLVQYNRNDVVLGITYKPTHNTAFKFDYTFFNNELNTDTFANAKQLNLGIGYYFF